jgi:hypothetical protein
MMGAKSPHIKIMKGNENGEDSKHFKYDRKGNISSER